MEPLVVAFDVLCALGFAVAAVSAMRWPLSPGRALEFGTKFAAVTMLLLYLFVSVSNVLEHAGITAAFDSLEDYAEILFVPLIAYVALSSASAARLRQSHRIQEQLRVEHDFSTAVMDATPAGIILVDNAGRVMFGNERARQLLGDVADEAFAGGPVFIERDGAFPQPKSLAEIGAALDLESRQFTLLGVEELRVLALTAAPMVDEGVIVSMLDMTARVQVDRELEQYRRDLEILVERRTEQLVVANMELEAANNAKKAFLANMSHELRTPLNTVLGFSGVLLKGTVGDLNAEQREQLQMIHEAGEQLLSMVDEVLDIAKIESGQVRVDWAPVDLGALAARVFREFEIAAQEAGIDMQLHVDDGTLVVESDLGKLSQVLRNLLGNAIKFTPEGGEVHLEVKRQGEDALVSVRDTGVGIAPYDQGRVFSAFYQARPPGEVTSQGAGLGLAIVSELCELIGARIEVQSAPGYGALFTVHVPTRTTVKRA